jgi:hypothetical protein
MSDTAATPSPDDSLRACFLAYDNMVDDLGHVMAFIQAASEDGPEEWKEAAQSAGDRMGFALAFLGVMQKALTDLRLATPGGQA